MVLETHGAGWMAATLALPSLLWLQTFPHSGTTTT